MPVARCRAARTSAEVALDSGSFPSVATAVGAGWHGASGRSVTRGRRAGSRASLAFATAFSGLSTAGLRPTATGPLDHPMLNLLGRSPVEKIRDAPMKEN